MNEVVAKHREFDVWMNAVDRECQKISGCSVWDLPECPFADWHEQYTPRAAAKKALKEAGWTTLSYVGGYRSEGFKVVR